MNLLVLSGAAYVVFTAAPPGQDGHHHVNCQPQSYWLSKFLARGYHFNLDATDRVKEGWSSLGRLSHMARNVMVLSP